MNHKSLQAMGYTDVCEVDGKTCGLYRLLFTFGLVVGLDAMGYSRRYCYEHEGDARAALESWDGKGHPIGPWIKVKGAGIDEINPELTA